MNFSLPLIDAHCHANLFSADLWTSVAERALKNGVRACVSAGVWWNEFSPFLSSHKDWILKRCRTQSEFLELFSDPSRFMIFPCLGLHPMEIATRWKDEHGDFNEKSARGDVESFLQCGRQFSEFIWAVGETGFDCAKDLLEGWSSKDELLRAQIFAFEASVTLALELNRPIVVHSRAAWQQTTINLEQAHARGLKSFMLHCYSGHASDLAWLVRLGGFASFGGVITWTHARRMKEALIASPESCFMFETDSPDLAPILPDGIQPAVNEPAFLSEIVKTAASLRQQKISELRERNMHNVVRFLFCT